MAHCAAECFETGLYPGSWPFHCRNLEGCGAPQRLPPCVRFRFATAASRLQIPKKFSGTTPTARLFAGPGTSCSKCGRGRRVETCRGSWSLRWKGFRETTLVQRRPREWSLSSRPVGRALPADEPCRRRHSESRSLAQSRACTYQERAARVRGARQGNIIPLIRFN